MIPRSKDLWNFWTHLNVRVVPIRHDLVLVKGQVHLAGKSCQQQRRLPPRRVDLTPIYRCAREPAESEVVDGAKVAVPAVPDVECRVEHICLLELVQLVLCIN